MYIPLNPKNIGTILRQGWLSPPLYQSHTSQIKIKTSEGSDLHVALKKYITSLI